MLCILSLWRSDAKRPRRESSRGIQSEAIQDTCGPTFEGLHHHTISELSKRTFDEGVMVLMVQGVMWWGECASNMWRELCLNPLRHHGTAWESLANVQRDGERVFMSCSYMLRCWMKRCLNMERTWGFWLHQSRPRLFWRCFPVVTRLMGAPCGCGSNSCKRAKNKMTPQVWKDIYFLDLKQNDTF